ncbi:MAG: Polyphenol oxidase [Massilia sp.]|jgi:YfiH family protein|nr:Polyphenol oxidase [Massilia sp.]
MAELIRPHWPRLPGNIKALATTRRGGVSTGPYDDGAGGGGLNLGMHVGDDPAHVRANRELLAACLPRTPAWISQVHGVAVVDAASVGPDQPVRVADASIATASKVVCAVMTADCLPVLFADVAGRVVGAAHAGWRGLADGVLAETLRAMRAAGAADITAWLGPAIGKRQFEVGADVFERFMAGAVEPDAVAAAFVPYEGRPGKYLADMNALARLLLAQAGVDDVAGGEYCTASDASRFYSYRRDGVTGRLASMIWLD